MIYLEDLYDGREFDLGSIYLSKQDMIDFSEKFDPQSFHLDEEVGTKMFGGLIASGWHTASLCHRLMVDNFLKQAACMASPGVDELRFIRPVFGDQELSVKMTLVSAKQSTSKPDRGLAKFKIEVTNEAGEDVLNHIGMVIIGCRPSDTDHSERTSLL